MPTTSLHDLALDKLIRTTMRMERGYAAVHLRKALIANQDTSTMERHVRRRATIMLLRRHRILAEIERLAQLAAYDALAGHID